MKQHADYLAPLIPAVVVQIDVSAAWPDLVAHSSSSIGQDDEEVVSCMQFSAATRSDGLLHHALQAYNLHRIRIFSWLHTWDRREQWSNVCGETILDPEFSVRDQLVAYWRSYQVRPSVTIVPVRPRHELLHRRHPVYLLLPVVRDDHIGMIVTVTTPLVRFQGSYLLRVTQWPRVFQVFHQLAPASASGNTTAMPRLGLDHTPACSPRATV